MKVVQPLVNTGSIHALSVDDNFQTFTIQHSLNGSNEEGF